MKYIYNLPVLLAIIFGLIGGYSAWINTNDFEIMAIKSSIAIIIGYVVGLLVRKLLIMLGSEVVMKMLYIEEKKRFLKKKAREDQENKVTT